MRSRNAKQLRLVTQAAIRGHYSSVLAKGLLAAAGWRTLARK